MKSFDMVGFDADDTLWHSEDSFHAGEQRFVDLVSPYASEGVDVKAALTVVERKNLAAFGYGVKAVGLSAVEAAIVTSKSSRSCGFGGVAGSTLGRAIASRTRREPRSPLPPRT